MMVKNTESVGMGGGGAGGGNFCGGVGVDSPLVGSAGCMFYIGYDESPLDTGLDGLFDMGVQSPRMESV